VQAAAAGENERLAVLDVDREADLVSVHRCAVAHLVLLSGGGWMRGRRCAPFGRSRLRRRRLVFGAGSVLAASSAFLSAAAGLRALSSMTTWSGSALTPA
jgi:hypothetical protein